MGQAQAGGGAQCCRERLVVEIAPERAEVALLDQELVLAGKARSLWRQGLDSSGRCPSRARFGRSAACRPFQQSACRAWRSRLEPFHHSVDDVFVDQGDAQTLARQLRELAGMLVAEPARGANFRPRVGLDRGEEDQAIQIASDRFRDKLADGTALVRRLVVRLEHSQEVMIRYRFGFHGAPPDAQPCMLHGKQTDIVSIPQSRGSRNTDLLPGPLSSHFGAARNRCNHREACLRKLTLWCSQQLPPPGSRTE